MFYDHNLEKTEDTISLKILLVSTQCAQVEWGQILPEHLESC